MIRQTDECFDSFIQQKLSGGAFRTHFSPAEYLGLSREATHRQPPIESEKLT
jgi:hypothetical protein